MKKSIILLLLGFASQSHANERYVRGQEMGQGFFNELNKKGRPLDEIKKKLDAIKDKPMQDDLKKGFVHGFKEAVKKAETIDAAYEKMEAMGVNLLDVTMREDANGTPLFKTNSGFLSADQYVEKIKAEQEAAEQEKIKAEQEAAEQEKIKAEQEAAERVAEQAAVEQGKREDKRKAIDAAYEKMEAMGVNLLDVTMREDANGTPLFKTKYGFLSADQYVEKIRAEKEKDEQAKREEGTKRKISIDIDPNYFNTIAPLPIDVTKKKAAEQAVKQAEQDKLNQSTPGYTSYIPSVLKSWWNS